MINYLVIKQMALLIILERVSLDWLRPDKNSKRLIRLVSLGILLISSLKVKYLLRIYKRWIGLGVKIDLLMPRNR